MKNSWIAAALGLGTLAGLTACHSTQAANAAATGYAGAAAPKAGYYTVPANQMAHVQVVAAALATWPHLLRLSGNVDYNQLATTPVISPVGGPVAKILAQPGDRVQAGQTLLEVSSPDYAQARNAYLKANDAAQLAQKTFRRDQDLYEHQALAQADLEAAESSLNQAQADLTTAEQSLRILGFPDPAAATAASPTALIPVKAPATGEIVERDVNAGQLVQAATTQCFVISNMRTVWVLANVYQSDLAYVHVGDPVTIETDAPTGDFHGRIQYLSPSLDPNSRTLQARIQTDNPGGALKRQMYVTALVQAGELRNIVVVPDAAVLRDDQNFPFVYVRSGESGQFERRRVELGESRDGFTQVTSGLRAGEAVAGNGALFVQFANGFSN